MNIFLNGKQIITSSQSINALRSEYGFPEGSITILNGFGVQDSALSENDRVHILEKGTMPDKDTLEELLYARHTPMIQDKFKKACVGIAGLGGLGSNIAVNLARTGIGRLVIADHDTVDPTNLNRQQYRIRHLGMYKTDALKAELGEINPYVEIINVNRKVTEENAAEIFGGCDIVCEAFDNAECKAMLVNTLLEKLPEVKVVAASGLAGLGSCNDIRTRKIVSRLIICGDGVSEAGCGTGLMAPRAAVCAGHQSNAVLQLILGEI